MKLKKALKLAAAELESAYLNEREYHDRCDKRVDKLDKALDLVEQLRKSKLVESLDTFPWRPTCTTPRARVLTLAREKGDSPRFSEPFDCGGCGEVVTRKL